MRIAVLVIAVAALAAGIATSVSASPEPSGLYLNVANGARVMKTPGKNSVYMVDRGVLRHVHYDAYVRLWEGWGGITLVNAIPETAVGEPVRGSTRLVQVKGEREIWFIDNDRVRRHLRSFRLTRFSKKKVQAITAEELEKYHEGRPLS